MVNLKPVYVEDWETIKKRWLAFWNCDMVDRPLLQISVPKKDAKYDNRALEAEHNIPKRKHADIAHIYNWGVYNLERTRFVAEGLPVLHSASSVGQALYYGCEARFDIHSAWAEPFPCEPDTLPNLVLDREGYWFRWHRDCLRFLAYECENRYFMLPTFGNHSSDSLALIRGTEQFLIDLMENPDWVKETDFRIAKELTDIINDRFVDVERSGMDGYLNDAGMWAPKRPWDIHCDVSSMVSTEMFKEIFWPSQKYVVDQSDGYNYYHVDGAGVLNHLDFILEEPNIQAIQWLAGDNRFHCLEYIDIYKKIRSKGKAIQVFAEYNDVLPFLKEVSPEGVCFAVLNCPGEDAAYKLVEDVTKLYR